MQTKSKIKRWDQGKKKYIGIIYKMGFKFGSLLGRALGSLGGALIPVKGIDGGAVGETLGSLAPFKHGGAVGKRKRAILVHPNEYVLPANAKPTKAQKAIVARNKAGAKKGKGKGK